MQWRRSLNKPEKESGGLKIKLAFRIVAAASFAFASIAYAGGVVDGSGNPHVPGESLDSGLGELSPSYTAAEYVNHVAGEKLDSGLGQLSRADVMKYARVQ